MVEWSKSLTGKLKIPSFNLNYCSATLPYLWYPTFGATSIMRRWSVTECHDTGRMDNCKCYNSYVQWGAEQTDYLPIYETNQGYFKRAKPTLKMLLGSWTFNTVLKGFRSFNAKNFGSVGQRAAKLPAIKLWEWFDRDRGSNPGTLADWGRGRLADLSWDLQLWQLVILQPFDLQTPNF